MFDKIRALYDTGSTVREIAQKLGLGPRRVYRWMRRINLPERGAMAAGLFWDIPRTKLGGGDNQGPPPVLRHTPPLCLPKI
jgi:hypothetical protein